jgi:hypothetical protein
MQQDEQRERERVQRTNKENEHKDCGEQTTRMRPQTTPSTAPAPS